MSVGSGNPTYGGGGQPLRLREEAGYEQARRVRNVIAHLRRGSATYKPLVVVVANSGVTEEVRKKAERGTTSTGDQKWSC